MVGGHDNQQIVQVVLPAATFARVATWAEANGMEVGSSLGIGATIDVLLTAALDAADG